MTDSGETDLYPGSEELVPEGTVVSMVRRSTAGDDASPEESPGSDAAGRPDTTGGEDDA
ncbi:hypothetical protein [Haloplanus salilacus]|uniref:hypothetical protein n=1 Tax=Haloplanus salilacus TaxID=2949994 RepID=UPI0030D32D42